MPNIFTKQNAAGVCAALAISAFVRWYTGTNLGV